MVSVQHIIGALMSRRPFVQEALARGIINYAALAEQLQPEVAEELRKPVTHAAVMMALRRHAEKLGKHAQKNVLFDQHADLTAKSDLLEITVVRSATAEGKIKQLYDLADFQQGDMLTVTHGLHEITIISNRKHRKSILQIFGKEVKVVIDDLAALTVRLPQESIEAVGMFYLCTRALSWENIAIVEMVSTYTELTFILRERDIASAYKALKALIAEQRESNPH